MEIIVHLNGSGVNCKFLKLRREYTLYEFNSLSEEQQYSLIFNEGIFLDEHREEDKRFALYALYKFFVEVEYETSLNKVTNKVSFVSGEKLDRYSKF